MKELVLPGTTDYQLWTLGKKLQELEEKNAERDRQYRAALLAFTTSFTLLTDLLEEGMVE